MQTIDGIDDLHMAGTRATFTLDSGAEVDRDAIAAAFEKRGMKLESVGTTEYPPEREVYLVGAGVT